MSRPATWWWNPPRVCTMRGVTKHVFDPNIRVAYTKILCKHSNVISYNPSLPRICERWAHAFRAFRRLVMTAGQLSFTSISVHPRYLKEYTIVRGCPYSLKKSSAHSHASSSAILLRLHSYPLAQRAVSEFRWLRSAQGMKMLQSGQKWR